MSDIDPVYDSEPEDIELNRQFEPGGANNLCLSTADVDQGKATQYRPKNTIQTPIAIHSSLVNVNAAYHIDLK